MLAVMGEPALLGPTFTEGSTNPAAAEEARALFSSGWTSLRDRLRAHPPEADSEEEARAIAEMAHLVISVTERAGAEFARLLGTAVARGIETMWRSEYAETPVERKLGMRWVSEAFNTLLELLETKLRGIEMPPDLPVEAFRDVIDQVAAWPRPLRSLLRLEVYSFVAFDLSGADVDEFCAWARRSATAARAARADWLDFSLASVHRPPVESGDVGLVVLSSQGASEVLDLLENPPPPNPALIALFRDA